MKDKVRPAVNLMTWQKKTFMFRYRKILLYGRR